MDLVVRQPIYSANIQGKRQTDGQTRLLGNPYIVEVQASLVLHEIVLTCLENLHHLLNLCDTFQFGIDKPMPHLSSVGG